MFEKFSILDVDSSGRGGEYTVQTGFGWTNGVVLYIASTYGKVLAAPDCPPIDLNAGSTGGGSGSGGGGNSSGAAGKRTTGLVGYMCLASLMLAIGSL